MLLIQANFLSDLRFKTSRGKKKVKKKKKNLLNCKCLSATQFVLSGLPYKHGKQLEYKTPVLNVILH